MPPAKRPNPTIRDREFRARLARRAQIAPGKAGQLIEIIKEELTRSLKSGHRVQIIDFGVFRRAAFPDRMMHDINQRGQKVMHRGGYYVSFAASPALKSKLRAIEPPASDAARVKIKYTKPSPLPQLQSEDTPAEDNDEGEAIKIIKKSRPDTTPPPNRGNIPINFRPKIPPLKWRREMPVFHLDLRGHHHYKPGIKLLKNLLRYAAHHDSAHLSMSPQAITFYGNTKSHTPISPKLYRLIADALRQQLPQLFRSSQSYRVLVDLPPVLSINLAALPSGADDFVILFQKPKGCIPDNGPPVEFDPIINKRIDGLLDRGQGRIAVVGTPLHRQKLFNALKDKFRQSGLVCHAAGESHHIHGLSGHYHTLQPRLRQMLQNAQSDTILAIEKLSRADNWYDLDAFPSVVVANTTAVSPRDFADTVKRQQLPDGFFDLALEAVAVPTLCRDCLPDFQPAVLYPQLRRVAIGRADRLGDILVGKKSPDCRHQTPTRFLVAGYKNDRHIGPSIADQIYQLILERELPVEAINAL